MSNITRRKTVTTVQRGVEGDEVGARIRRMLQDVAQLQPDGFIQRLHEEAGGLELKLHVHKKIGAAGMSKVGEYNPIELDPETVEAQIIQTWGAGIYQFRLSHRGKTYNPASMPWRIGEIEEPKALPGTVTPDGTDEAIALVNKRLGQLAVARDLKKVLAEGEPEGEDMKAEQLVQLATALKPDNTALVSMLDAANRRADAAEQRSHELTLKMMEQRSTATQGALPMVAELLKTVKPEVWQTLLTPPQEGTDWLGTIRDVVREVGPGLRDMIGAYLAPHLARAGAPALPAARTVPVPAATTDPAPTHGAANGGSPMPLELNDEQKMSKDMLIEFIRANDFANAFAVLASFPGFAPSAQGVMPLGDFILSRIDPVVNPRVYLPQLAMLFPEVKAMAPQGVAFIEYVQRKLIADDEALRREESRRAADPKPTTEDGHDD